MAGFDLANILNGITELVSSIEKDKGTTAGKQGENSVLREQGVNAVIEAGKLNQELDSIDSQQKLEMESRKKATAQAFNVDMLDPDNRIAYLAREQVAAQDEALARSKRASNLVDMNFFDSPLEYMVARPFADRHAQAAAAAQSRAQNLDKAIMDLNQQTQATVQTQKAITTEFSIEEAEAQARLVGLKAQDAIRQAQMAKNNADIGDLKVLRGMTEEQLKASTEGYKLRRHEQEFQARMAEMAEARKARAAAKKNAEDDLSYLQLRYNLGAEMIGRPKAVNLEDFGNLIKYNKKYVTEVAMLGEDVWIDPNDPSAQTKLMRLGSTPGKAQMTLEYFKGNLKPTAERTSALLSLTSGMAKDVLKGAGGKVTPDDVSREINRQLMGEVKQTKKGTEKVTGVVERMYLNAEDDAGKLPNIYRAPSVQVIGENAPALVQNPAWKEIVMPAVTASGPSPTVDSMARQAQLAIREGKIKPEEASRFMSTYFGTAMQLNKVNEGYLTVGLPVPTTYNAQIISNEGVFGKKVKRIDATNEKMWDHYFASQSSKSTLDKLAGSNPYATTIPFGSR